jgi:hypothetical protein
MRGAYHEHDEQRQPLPGDPSDGRERVGEWRKRERGGFSLSLPRPWVRKRGEGEVVGRAWGGEGAAGPRRPALRSLLL